MFHGDTIDTGKRKEAERQKEKTHPDKCENAEGDRLLGGGKRRQGPHS